MYRTIKRIADFTAAAALLVCTAPLMAIIAAAVLAAIGRPVLFRQRRPGLNEHIFTCLKFRTMTDARSPDGTLLPDRLRLTRFGRFLRRTSLDELPQLWNILTGDLSFVGPRPLLEEYLPYYSSVERRRHSVRPGLTGWAQIHGRNSTSFEERLAMDIWYVDHASLTRDFRILLSTIWLVISQKGIEPVVHGSGAVRLDVLRRSNQDRHLLSNG
jgi:lipopolysaccharide/colanic/teichoic acid biosynthesis glycosyltransferase